MKLALKPKYDEGANAYFKADGDLASVDAGHALMLDSTTNEVKRHTGASGVIFIGLLGQDVKAAPTSGNSQTAGAERDPRVPIRQWAYVGEKVAIYFKPGSVLHTDTFESGYSPANGDLLYAAGSGSGKLTSSGNVQIGFVEAVETTNNISSTTQARIRLV